MSWRRTPTKAERTAIRLLAVALPLVMLSLVPHATGARTTFPGRDGLIVFESDRGGNFDLYVTGVTQPPAPRILLTRPDTDEFNAAWSPSGNRLVFETGRQGGEFDIALLNANGSGFTTLVGGATNDFGAQFCDANTIVFTRQETPTNSEVYRVETNGSGLTRLTDNPARDSFPTCSPDGRTVAFISARESGLPGIFGMNLDGGNVRRLVPGVGLDPDFSPDGQSLVYVAPDANRNLELWRTPLGGTPEQLTSSNPPLEYRQPEFFPSSTQRAHSFVFTLRNATTGGKEVRTLVAGAERTIAASGSGASAQSRPICECLRLDAVIEPNSLDIISDSRGGVRMRGRLRWTLDCSSGERLHDGVGCFGLLTIDITQPRNGLRFVIFGARRDSLQTQCNGDCARRERDMRTFELVGGPALGRGRRGTKVGSVILVMRRSCGRRELRPREFIIVFARDGRIDRSRSDLNGDRKPDGRD